MLRKILFVVMLIVFSLQFIACESCEISFKSSLTDTGFDEQWNERVYNAVGVSVARTSKERQSIESINSLEWIGYIQNTNDFPVMIREGLLEYHYEVEGIRSIYRLEPGQKLVRPFGYATATDNVNLQYIGFYIYSLEGALLGYVSPTRFWFEMQPGNFNAQHVH